MEEKVFQLLALTNSVFAKGTCEPQLMVHASDPIRLRRVLLLSFRPHDPIFKTSRAQG